MGTEDFCIIEGYLSMIFWLGIEDFRVHCFWQTVQYHAIPASVESLSAMPAYGMHFEGPQLLQAVRCDPTPSSP